MSHLIITPGDPTGIGPEITVKALQRLAELPPDLRLTIVGSKEALDRAARQLGKPLPDTETVNYKAVEGEQVGSISYRSIEKAVELIAGGEGDLLVTGPISKRHLAEADYAFGGHTEILEHLAHQFFKVADAHAEMIFVHKNLRLLLLTRHIALKDVSVALAEKGAVARPLKTLIAFLRHQVGIDTPRLAMLGLNPHAGEINGDEEEKYFLPVINAVNAIGASQIDGPFPADGFFRGFSANTTPYHAIVAAYHDQGLIPFKLLAGHEAVNVTIGLPFLRTSVSHGTAEDIVGQGIAHEDSLMAALHEACKLKKHTNA